MKMRIAKTKSFFHKRIYQLNDFCFFNWTIIRDSVGAFMTEAVRENKLSLKLLIDRI